MVKADGGKGVAAYIVPTEDPHMSEYPPDPFKRREYISSFTGSAGTAVVTADHALLWTDGRYFLQAETELGPEWTLMRGGTGSCPEINEWLADTLPEGSRVGFDPFCHTVEAVNKLKAKLQEKGLEAVPLLADGNLVDQAWGADRPGMPTAPLRVHEAVWAGASIQQKVDEVRQSLAGVKADCFLATTLDEVAWLYNLRGSDVPYNPVFVSYALVSLTDAVLYTNPEKVPPTVAEHLKAGGVAVRPYEQLVADVKAKAAAKACIAMDLSKVSYAVYQAAEEAAAAGPRGRKRNAADAVVPAAAGASKAVVDLVSPVVAAKAIKNAAELEGMRQAHLRDAVAICDFLNWLENKIASGATLTEVEVELELTGRRKQQQGFIEPSFPTIAGANGNGAIIHYRAQEGTCKTVDAKTLLLVDSGGQYDCGTTDITRTLHFGSPTEHQRRCYTRVLQGHIALAQAVFPEGTPGTAIDALARLPLWRDGLNYRHGTGHGVGAALNVHEGPQSISTRYWITTPLQVGMICSNEPGYYEDGGFGIRVENLLVIKEADTEFRFGGATFMSFEDLTLVPIQIKMINPALLTDSEEQWLDSYHKLVWQRVSPLLADKPDVLAWLKRNTAPLKEQLAAAEAAAAPAAAMAAV
ncbi:peptidase M24, structural domain-containing protein [Scenedesmus sp. NREL 46B-D3]|nr:peptidase M24, structural domain-containing protein [Scenedesmus sp. NREL 46B-D3]